MADYKKIDDFSEASAFEDTDKLLVSKAKVTYTILGSKIKAFCQAAISTLVAQVNSDATAAANAKTAAQTAQTNAETANTNAQDAKTAALSAKTDAETAASTATAAAAAMQECAPYDNTKSYSVGNMATYNGSTYRCTVACTGVVPTTTSNWLLIAAAGKDGTGTGDMMTSVYDAAGGAKQVAFSADVAVKSTVLSLTLTSSGWTGSAAPYTQTLAASGVTESTNGIPDLAVGASDDAEKQMSSCNIHKSSQAAGTITFTAKKAKPTVDIPITVILIG